MNNPSQNDPSDWEALVERYLFGELDEAEMQRLSELLDADPSLRQRFVKQATWETELADAFRSDRFPELAASEASMAVQLVEQAEEQRGRSVRVLRGLLGLATVAILVLCGLLMNRPKSMESQPVLQAASGQGDSIARITGLSGSLVWTGDRGRVISEIGVGTSLAGGTIEGLSPDSWFELAFLDGTRVMISGASLLTFSDDGQKKLRLREGRMSADVTTQPQDKPMVVETRTATLTVLGTSFDVEAELPTTTVNVREGRVRVRRNSDGKAIDVPAKHRVIAAADRDLENQLVPGYVHQWRSRIDLGPDETFGQWIAASEQGEEATLKAVAFVPKEAPDLVLYLAGLGVHSADGSPVQVLDGARFELRGRLALETEVYLGVQVAYPNGNFAGKFLAKCGVERNDDGSFVAQAALRDFGLDPSVWEFRDKLAAKPDDLLVNGIWCFTHSTEPSGLRVSQFALRPPDVTSAQ